MSNKLKFQFSVVVGDWSDDGHGKTDTFIIKSSISRDEFEKLFRGIEKEFEPCQDYEDSSLSEAHIAYLQNLELDENVYGCYGNGNKKFYLEDTWSYTQMILDIIAKKHDFEFEFNEMETVNIGGYGLFD